VYRSFEAVFKDYCKDSRPTFNGFLRFHDLVLDVKIKEKDSGLMFRD